MYDALKISSIFWKGKKKIKWEKFRQILRYIKNMYFVRKKLSLSIYI